MKIDIEKMTIKYNGTTQIYVKSHFTPHINHLTTSDVNAKTN